MYSPIHSYPIDERYDARQYLDFERNYQKRSIINVDFDEFCLKMLFRKSLSSASVTCGRVWELPRDVDLLFDIFESLDDRNGPLHVVWSC
jgi:hypothetical protein